MRHFPDAAMPLIRAVSAGSMLGDETERPTRRSGDEVHRVVSNGLVAKSLGLADSVYLSPLPPSEKGAHSEILLSQFYAANVPIGECGAYGTCTLGFHKSSSTPCVVKSVPVSKSEVEYRKEMCELNLGKYLIDMTHRS